MCSIIGYNGDYNQELVEKLCFNSRIRGLHSFGYSYYDKEELVVEKFLDYNLFLKSLNKTKPTKFIAHFRYSTSGDYKNQTNNQPLKIDNTSLVFNGVIDMGTKSEMEEKHNVKMFSDNDGELALLKKSQSDEVLIDFITDKTFAGIFLEKNKIKAIRNDNRPCYKGMFEKIKIIVSTKDILLRSGVNEFEELEPKVFVEL